MEVAHKLASISHHVSLTGGEPLVLKDELKEIIETLVENHGVTVSMVSNMTLADADMMKFLADKEVYLYVSVESASRKTHETVRPGSWDRLVKGLAILMDLGVEYSTVTTVNRINYSEAWKVLEFADRFGAECSCYIPVIPVGRAAETRVMPTPNQLLEAFRKVVDEADRGGYYAKFWCSPVLKPYRSSRNVLVYGCSRGALDVAPNGDILLCDTMDIVISNIFKEPKEIVWDCEESPQVKLFESIPEECLDCRFKDICRGGCRSRAYNVYGSMLKPDPLCPMLYGST